MTDELQDRMMVLRARIWRDDLDLACLHVLKSAQSKRSIAALEADRHAAVNALAALEAVTRQGAA